MDIGYKTLRAIGLCHNYNMWIYEMIKPYLGQEVLEIGCGIGNLTEYLKENRNLTSIDMDSKYVEYMKLDFPEVGIYHCDIVEPHILHDKKNSYDSVVCINVLEHIEDDKKALSNMYDLLKKSGNIILMVPAHQLLFGAMDQNIGHWRRYSKKDLINKVEQTGFIVKKVFYFNRTGVMGWFINSRIRKKKQISFIQLFLFDRIAPLVQKMDSLFNLPFGLSIFIVGEK